MLKPLHILLIWIVSSNVLKTLSCTTPLFIDREVDVAELISVIWCLFLRKDLIHCNSEFVFPTDLSLLIISLRIILPKGFLISKYSITVIFITFASNLVKEVYQEYIAGRYSKEAVLWLVY